MRVIYIDRPVWPGRGRLWSHLISDTSYYELHAFAEMLGVTREAINKQLKAWSKQNLLRVERGFITVTDKAGLAALARSDDDKD